MDKEKEVSFSTTLTRSQERDYHEGGNKIVALTHKQLTTPGMDRITISKGSLEAISKAVLEGKGAKVRIIRYVTLSPTRPKPNSTPRNKPALSPPKKKDDTLLTMLSTKQRGKAKKSQRIRLDHEQLTGNPAIDGLALSREDKDKVLKALHARKGTFLTPTGYNPSRAQELKEDSYIMGYNKGYITGHRVGAENQNIISYDQGYRDGVEARNKHPLAKLAKPNPTSLIVY